MENPGWLNRAICGMLISRCPAVHVAMSGAARSGYGRTVNGRADMVHMRYEVSMSKRVVR